MNSNAKLKFVFTFVTNHKVFLHSLDQMQRHARYLSCVLMSIPDRQSWYHHVRVTNCLHLPGRRSALEYNTNNGTKLEVEQASMFNVYSENLWLFVLLFKFVEKNAAEFISFLMK